MLKIPHFDIHHIYGNSFLWWKKSRLQWNNIRLISIYPCDENGSQWWNGYHFDECIQFWWKIFTAMKILCYDEEKHQEENLSL